MFPDGVLWTAALCWAWGGERGLRGGSGPAARAHCPAHSPEWAIWALIPTMRWGTELGPGGPHGTKHREWGALPGVRQPRESGSESGAGPDHTAQKSHLHGRGPSPSRPRPGLEHRREPGAEPAGEARPGGRCAHGAGSRGRSLGGQRRGFGSRPANKVCLPALPLFPRRCWWRLPGTFPFAARLRLLPQLSPA